MWPERPGGGWVRGFRRDYDGCAIWQRVRVPYLRRAGDEVHAGLIGKVDQFRQRVEVVEGIRSLADQQSTERGIALTEAPEIAVEAALVVVEVGIWVQGPEVEFDVGPGFA